MRNLTAILFLFVLALSVISCNSKSEDAKKITEDTVKTTPTTETPSMNNQTPINITTSPQSGTATPAGMNPPHGQPGHDCKIAVGSPLNSAAQNNSTPPIGTQNPVMQTSPRVNATQVTPPGMNPPHGQPGHDCKIPVGQPLNSGK